MVNNKPCRISNFELVLWTLSILLGLLFAFANVFAWGLMAVFWTGLFWSSVTILLAWVVDRL